MKRWSASPRPRSKRGEEQLAPIIPKPAAWGGPEGCHPTRPLLPATSRESTRHFGNPPGFRLAGRFGDALSMLDVRWCFNVFPCTYHPTNRKLHNTLRIAELPAHGRRVRSPGLESGGCTSTGSVLQSAVVLHLRCTHPGSPVFVVFVATRWRPDHRLIEHWAGGDQGDPVRRGGNRKTDVFRGQRSNGAFEAAGKPPIRGDESRLELF